MANFQGSRINPRKFSASQIKFYVLLVPLAVVMILPVIFIISQAFKPMDELYRFPPTLLAERPTLRNFQNIWGIASATAIPLLRYLVNSIIITVVTVVLSVLLTASTAYALSKKKFRARPWLLRINQAALMFVPVAVAVPRYLVIVNTRMGNTYFAHILPLLAMPVGLFLVKQFVDQVPDAILEAARIDGAGEFSVMFRVVFPQIGPALATVGILCFQAVWNATEASNIYITDETMKSFAFYLGTLTVDQSPAMQGIGAAAALIMFAPNLIIFIAMQSRVMNTMSHSGIK
ncbi:MAG: carbohydrate ABC transporter permease [Oscillospiraceae bacterium]|jgi:multiple sugar transport system permease protein|nr:carbohydrate ABC transporter permease [Oscillospiraceae bacterium]